MPASKRQMNNQQEGAGLFSCFRKPSPAQELLQDLDDSIRVLEGKVADIEQSLDRYRQQVSSLRGPMGQKMVQGPLQQLERVLGHYRKQLDHVRRTREELLRACARRGGNRSGPSSASQTMEEELRMLKERMRRDIEENRMYEQMAREAKRQAKEMLREAEMNLRRESMAAYMAYKGSQYPVHTGKRGGRYILVGGNRKVYV